MNVAFPPVGHIICSSSDGTNYTQVSGPAQITVYFKNAKCVFDDVTPSARYPFLAKWSPNCNACCFMGEYKGMPCLISIYLASDGRAGLDAWNLGKVPGRVIFEEREGMSDLCVPVLHGQKIYKSPFNYDDSIYTFKNLISHQPADASSIHRTITKQDRKLHIIFNDIVFVLKSLAIILAIGIVFLLAIFIVMLVIAGLMSIF